MAITADVLLAVAVVSMTNESARVEKNDGPLVKISNMNSTKFEDRQFFIPVEDDVKIVAETHEWSNYFKAGLRGALSWLRRNKYAEDDLVPASMDILVDGSVPEGSGLSSSAAFVCASAMAVLRANGEETVDRKHLVELAIVSERAVGVNSGG